MEGREEVVLHKTPTNPKGYTTSHNSKKEMKVRKTRIKMNLLKTVPLHANSNLLARCMERSNE